jgi:hypothetical protein
MPSGIEIRAGIHTGESELVDNDIWSSPSIVHYSTLNIHCE